jgi:glycosyltransferase involved in cell wall biosynthesis
MVLKVVVDESWNGVSGTGRYSTELTERLKKSPKFQLQGFTQPRPANPLAPFELTYELTKYRASSVFWSPQYMMPIFAKQRIVITIHDLIMMRYRSKSKTIYFQYFLKKVYQRADKIITVSNAVRDELIDWIGCPPEDVIVVTNGLSSTFMQAGDKQQLEAPYFLYVGNHRPHKNLHRMIKAFAIFRQRQKCLLVLSGSVNEELMQLARQLGVADDLRFVGFPDNLELATWYRGAVGTLYVSIYEGFGLPIIESMACGTPVITSNVGAMAETAAGAAFLVDPYDEEDMANALRQVFEQDEACRIMAQSGLRRSGEFSWDTSFEKLSSILLTMA